MSSKAGFHKTVFIVGVGGALLIMGAMQLSRRRPAGEDSSYLSSLDKYLATIREQEDAQVAAALAVESTVTAQVEPTLTTSDSDIALASRAREERRRSEPSIWGPA